MTEILLALDLGTTSVKASAFKPNGVCIASALEEYQLISPVADQAEVNPETYWQASLHTLQKVLKKCDAVHNKVLGISVSSQGETLICVDKDGSPLMNALVWIDNRAEEEAEILKPALMAELYAHTGIPEMIATWTICKILWIKRNRPEIFAKVGKFLLVQDYILYRLTDKYVTNGSISCTTGYFDIRENKWWQKALKFANIDENCLPEITDVGNIIGETDVQINALLNLPYPIAVIGGGMDQAVGAIGAGTVVAGIASETTGSALCIQVVTDAPDLDPRQLTPVYIHSIAGMYLFVPVCPTAGMAFKWFKDTFGTVETEIADADDGNVYDLLTAQAAQIAPGADGLIMLPHLMGAFSPISNPAARGSFTGFTIHHTKGHFVRAIQEGVAYMLRQNLESVMESGVHFSEVRATGGGAKSALWNQIKADVCRLPIVLLENEDTGVLGNAILVGAACGVFKTIQEGAEKMVRVKTTVLPSANMAKYDDFYRDYCRLDRAMSAYFGGE